MKTEEQVIASFLDTLFQQEEFKDCFVIEVTPRKQSAKWEIFIDADQGLTLNRCASINRKIRSLIEEKGLANWGIEVSSPGLDRPLLIRRQFVKNIGRDLMIQKIDGGMITGQLEQVGDQGIVLAIQGKKKHELKQENIGWDSITTSKVLPKFKKKVK